MSDLTLEFYSTSLDRLVATYGESNRPVVRVMLRFNLTFGEAEEMYLRGTRVATGPIGKFTKRETMPGKIYFVKQGDWRIMK